MARALTALRDQRDLWAKQNVQSTDMNNKFEDLTTRVYANTGSNTTITCASWSGETKKGRFDDAKVVTLGVDGKTVAGVVINVEVLKTLQSKPTT